MLLLYQIAVRLYLLGIRLAAPFVPKAQKWVKGRQGLFEQLQANIDPARPLIWMHCASLGEFEQGRPILESLRKKYPEHFLLLTFFSPSGYEIRKDYPVVDLVTYLPGDTPAQAARFVGLIRPKLVIFVKYEFWLYHLRALFDQQIPVMLISAIFRPSQLFFKWYGGPFRKLLKQFSHIFVQDQSSFDLLRSKGLEALTISGDTRVDRVAQLAASAPTDQVVQHFAEGKKLLIAGSTWPPDEALLCQWINEDADQAYAYVIAPHDIAEAHLLQIEQQLSVATHRYSQGSVPSGTRVLLIDNIGKLSALYQYGQLAYIGGGFGSGIHNILEPAAFGLPIIFGPRYHKFEEARVLLRSGGAFHIEDFEGLSEIFIALKQEKKHHKAATAALEYIHTQQGASQMIIQYIRLYSS